MTQSSVGAATVADSARIAEIDEQAGQLFDALGLMLVELPPLDAEPRQILVIGSPAFGMVRIDDLDGNAHIQELAVAPEHMRRGAGSALVRAACEWARDRDFAAVTLTTFADVPWNQPFYERLGFVVVDERGPELQRRWDYEAPLRDAGRRVVMRLAL